MNKCSVFHILIKSLTGYQKEKDIFVELNFLIMIIDDALPKFDLPVDFVTDDSITGDILNQYGRFALYAGNRTRYYQSVRVYNQPE